jgi:hypothetical protein
MLSWLTPTAFGQSGILRGVYGVIGMAFRGNMESDRDHVRSLLQMREMFW